LLRASYSSTSSTSKNGSDVLIAFARKAEKFFRNKMEGLE